ncbi:MAG TPA: CCA tRNA nucleotidyltransferase [Chthoniobacteraceae bacterium]|nr:CCA tRNA nucleotidyltransferase [Chthoniobacteraceae bacterium]
METEARSIVARLREAGHAAYYAGGCVRDALLGLTPGDYDIATGASPAEVQQLFKRTYAVGVHFGVVIVLIGRNEYQVATFRTDGVYIDGRHPEKVTFATPEQDAWRRDFTINGMFYDPMTRDVIDYVGGRADLQARLIRAIGNPDDRFREDRLRLLRAVRFAATFGFAIEPATWQAIRTHAPTIGKISPERIREELVRIFMGRHRVAGLDLLSESGLLKEVLPEVEALKGCEQPPQFHPEGDVYVHTRRMLELLPEKVSLPLVLSVLFHDIGKPPTFTVDTDGRIRFNGHDKVGAEMTEAVMTRLRFSRETIDTTVEAVARHMIFKDVQKMRVARLKRFMAHPHFDDELELHRVDCASSHGMLDNYDFLKTQREVFAAEPLIPPPLINGRDLIALGWKPGPEIGEVLEAVETRQLEGSLATREEALAFVREHYRQWRGKRLK